jgi:hypothetical protein
MKYRPNTNTAILLKKTKKNLKLRGDYTQEGDGKRKTLRR